MNTPGIRFYPSSIEVDTSGSSPFILHGRLKDKCSDFDYIFRCVYHLWNGLKFLDEDVLKSREGEKNDECEDGGQLF